MKYLFCVIAFLLIHQKASSQEEMINIYTSDLIRQSFNVVDQKSGNFAVFLEGSNSVLGFLYNENKKEIGRIESTDLPNKYQELIGYLIDGKTIILFMNTKNGRSYGVLKFDFENNISTVEELDFKLKKEGYLESLSIDNTFYLFSRPNHSNQINIYEFNSDLTSTLHEIKFKKDEFLDRRDKPIHLYEILSDPIKIENKTPNSIETTSKNVKLYNHGKKVSITSDRYKEYTYLINIDLENYNYSSERIFKPPFEDSYFGLRTNSFLFENNLFQIISSSDQLNIQITDIDTKETIKKYSVKKKEPISFKNSLIIQEGGGLDKYRELDKTSQFLRKISQAHAGISVLKQDGVFQITYGSAIEKTNAGGYVIIGATVGGIGGAIVMASINSITTSYYGYTNTKSVRVTGLFDKNFNHIEGEVPLNIFDRIKLYAENIKGLQAETIISLEDSYLFGYYNKKEKVYKLVKFTKKLTDSQF